MMRKSIFLMLIICLAHLALFAQQQDAVIGVWLNADKDAKVEIYKFGNKYNGKIVWIKNVYEPDGKTPRKDNKNPEPRLRNRNINGLVILSEFQHDDGEWAGGKIYDPKSGKTYSSKMKLSGNNLDIRGYVGTPLFGRTTVWTKSSL